MRCAACGFENVPDASFSGEYGTSFRSTMNCSACGRANPLKKEFYNACGRPLSLPDDATSGDPRGYKPKHLAEEILTSRSALEDERKQETVLFADVKGSMDLAEPILHEVSAELARLRGDEATCEGEPRETLQLFRKTGATQYAERAAWRLE